MKQLVAELGEGERNWHVYEKMKDGDANSFGDRRYVSSLCPPQAG